MHGSSMLDTTGMDALADALTCHVASTTCGVKEIGLHTRRDG